jgi:signal transduction histidine kinase
MLHVLIVEDNQADADLACEMFAEDPALQFEVTLASNLKEAIGAVDLRMPDAVLLDLNLPDSQGLETLSRVRTTLADNVAVVVLTGVGDEKLAQSSIKLNAQDYLVKGRLGGGILARSIYYSVERQRLQLGVRRIINANPDGIVVVDADGLVLFANPAASILFNSPLAKMIGELFGYPVVRDESAELNIGLNKVAEMRVADIEWYGIAAFLVTLRDISERKNIEQVAHDKSLAFERSNAELQSFAYAISHDMQEPLRMISSYVKLLGHRYKDKLDQDADDFINYAVDGVDRLSHMITDLLDYARVDARGHEPQPTQSSQALQDALANLDSAIQESGAVVDVGNLPMVMADQHQLARLFQNLISNAIKYRSPDRQPHILISSIRQGGDWQFSISDNGIGIEPEFFGRLFQLFQRLHNRQEYPGTGIGLATSKKIVERLGGRIWIESTPGKGSIFHFTLQAPLPNMAPSLVVD